MRLRDKTFLLRWRPWILGMLLVCFGSLTLFEPVIHAHELDPTHLEENCAPCNWSRTFVGDDPFLPDIEYSDTVFQYQASLEKRFSQLSCHSVSNRSPPSIH